MPSIILNLCGLLLAPVKVRSISIFIILLLLGSVLLMNLLFVVNWKYLKEKPQWCREQALVYQTLEDNESETQQMWKENYRAVAI